MKKIKIDNEFYTIQLGEWVRTEKRAGKVTGMNWNGTYFIIEEDTPCGVSTRNIDPNDIIGIGRLQPKVSAKVPDPLIQFLDDNPAEPAMKERSKNGIEKPRLSLIPQEAIVEVARVFGYGANKYEAYNFSKGARKTTYTDAAMRHINRYLLNEDIDPESGFNHLAHAACCILMLLDNDIIKTSIEDRNKEYKVNDK